MNKQIIPPTLLKKGFTIAKDGSFFRKLYYKNKFLMIESVSTKWLMKKYAKMRKKGQTPCVVCGANARQFNFNMGTSGQPLYCDGCAAKYHSRN